MSVVLAVTMATSCLATGLTALAADSWPNRENTKERGEAQPHFSGYRMKDVRNWDSETDPFAEMMQAKVPLQDRNEAFKPTQADVYKRQAYIQWNPPARSNSLPPRRWKRPQWSIPGARLWS